MAQVMRKPAGGVTLDALWEFMLRLEAEIRKTQAIEARNESVLASIASAVPITASTLSARDMHDIDIINANADIINAQAEENLLFQDIPWEDE
ncbi:MAG: hypothetical protein LBM77_12055 [Spirochaetaceae bacterium]|jgi:uncharacterized HAD superfamily protein|nr:hypothetical protein [Spirochaetaceae bacterium]